MVRHSVEYFSKRKKMTSMMKLVFSSSIDLQTQLQLVPLNDEECIGAKVLAIGNDESAGSRVNNATLIRISRSDEAEFQEQGDDDWRMKDFEYIVTSLREMTDGPVIVWIELSEDSGGTDVSSTENDGTATEEVGNTQKDVPSSGAPSSSTTEEEDKPHRDEGHPDADTTSKNEISSLSSVKQTENIASKVIKRGLLNWGTSISKHAANITSAAVEVVAVTVASNSTATSNNTSSHFINSNPYRTVDTTAPPVAMGANVIDISTVVKDISGLPQNRHCHMYLQSDGKFVSVADESSISASGKVILPSTSPIKPRTLERNASSSYSTILVTNSSFLQIRLSEEKPCPPDYKFQWYRSSSSPEWIPILGANKCGYQPSAIDVGKHVKCIILFIEVPPPPFSDDADTRSSTEDCVEEVVLPVRVFASSDLFNAARQNFYNGSIFNNIKGRGKASGRDFRIKIKVGASTPPISSATCSHLWIYQVCGNTAESLVADEFPLLNVSAAVDACHPKHFDLIFSTLPDTASMIQALTEDNRSNHNKFSLPLLAPNRISRESLLLALGIANHTGKPSELTPVTILFPDITLRIEEEGNSSLRSTMSIHQEELLISSPSWSRAQSIGTANTDDIEVLDNAHAGPLALGSISTDSRNNMDSETKKKLHSMELEIVKLTTLLTTKKDFSQSLQAQVLLLEDDNHKKDLEIENFQQDLLSCQRKYQETCEMLAVTRSQIDQHECILNATRQEYSERITLLNEKTVEYKERYEEYEAMVKSLQDDKCALSQALHDREDKLIKMQEMQLSITALKKELESKKEQEEELNNMRAVNLDIVRSMEEVERCNQHIRHELEQAELSLAKANMQIQDYFSNIASLEAKVISLDQLNNSLCTERNSYRQKAESLSKEMSRIFRHGFDIKEIEQLMADSERMRRQIRDLENEKRYQKAEIKRLSSQYDELLDSQVKSKLSSSISEPAISQNPLHRSLSVPVSTADTSLSIDHKLNLERVITNLTEHLNAKEYQLETITQVNRSLMEEIQFLTAKVNQPGGKK